jgi:hypothetical protein
VLVLDDAIGVALEVWAGARSEQRMELSGDGSNDGRQSSRGWRVCVRARERSVAFYRRCSGVQTFVVKQRRGRRGPCGGGTSGDTYGGRRGRGSSAGARACDTCGGATSKAVAWAACGLAMRNRRGDARPVWGGARTPRRRRHHGGTRCPGAQERGGAARHRPKCFT